MPISTFEHLLSSIKGSSDGWSPDREKVMLDPFTYVASNPGKDIRRTLIVAFDLWLNVPKTKLDVVAQVVDTVHNASLMLDDIEDDSDLRRGKSAAHKVYGIPQTINSATYALWIAYQRLLSIRPSATDGVGEGHSPLCNKALDQIFTEELLHLHRGQGLDMHWRDSFTCPTEDEYVEMARGKASSVLRLSVRLMMAFSTNTNMDLVHLVDLIGVFGQIRDDYMNLQSKEYTDTKGLADDISEGKFSFPIIHGIQENPDSTVILDILKQRPKTPSLKHQAIAYLRDVTHSFDYTLQVMRSLEVQIRDEIFRLGGNPVLEALIDKLHQ
ncbi:hypothetical protein SCLCIDRAFT_1213696 [Scleroderma citrinum Foug A]|uniref:(2E,6E)-farnesyl diphosphate synthase n=1 Tax=Scleroderma citrinum Foug A TaxID=1036808 RepID=A0A0C3E628_9AGAM|nr:hypothetical protein SCLCIDRAFT_1213696 [Scleroderma citrinum Foug A]